VLLVFLLVWRSLHGGFVLDGRGRFNVIMKSVRLRRGEGNNDGQFILGIFMYYHNSSASNTIIQKDMN
jgi:hypothetical protein